MKKITVLLLMVASINVAQANDRNDNWNAPLIGAIIGVSAVLAANSYPQNTNHHHHRTYDSPSYRAVRRHQQYLAHRYSNQHRYESDRMYNQGHSYSYDRMYNQGHSYSYDHMYNQGHR